MADFDMVFEGGGAKGSVFVGALRELAKRGHRPKRLIGTSAGAITAALLAVGYTPDELLAAVNERGPDGKPRFASFMDRPSSADFDQAIRDQSETMKVLQIAHVLPTMFTNRLLDGLLGNSLYCQLFGFVECGGLYAGNAFRAWLQEKLGAKGIAPGATLAQVNQQKGCDLTVCITDLDDAESMALNHRTAPDVPLAWAVRMSMSIPFVWREVVWAPEWGTYLGRAKAGHVIVDGGVLSNFPLYLVAESTPRSRQIMGDADPTMDRNLGLLIDETIDVPNSGPTPPKTHELAVARRVTKLVDAMTGARDSDTMRDHADEICRLPAKGYGTTDFDMVPDRLSALVAAGQSAMCAYLDGMKL